MSPTATANQPQPDITTALDAAVRYDRQADVAQLAEHRFCKPGVAGSIPAVGFAQAIGRSRPRVGVSRCHTA